MPLPRKRDRTRSALLDGALRLFVEHGYEATTMSDIAAAGGVVRQTVLNHFPRKEDFVLAWGRRRRRQLDDVPLDVTAATATVALRRLYGALAAVNEREQALTRALHPFYQAIAVDRQVPAAVLAAIEHGQASGEFTAAVPAATAAEVLTAVYFDTLTRWLAAPLPQPLSPLLIGRIELVIDGLGRR